MPARDQLRGRIDAALEKMRADQMEVRAIYLTEAERDQLDRILSKEYGSKLYTFQYRGHDLRTGQRSAIYSKHGVEVAIPKKLSRRVTA